MMAKLSPADWAALADAGETTWTVGKANAWAAAYADPGEAAAAAAEAPADAGLFQWKGHRGQPVPDGDRQAWEEAWSDSSPQAAALAAHMAELADIELARAEREAEQEAEAG